MAERKTKQVRQASLSRMRARHAPKVQECAKQVSAAGRSKGRREREGEGTGNVKERLRKRQTDSPTKIANGGSSLLLLAPHRARTQMQERDTQREGATHKRFEECSTNRRMKNTNTIASETTFFNRPCTLCRDGYADTHRWCVYLYKWIANWTEVDQKKNSREKYNWASTLATHTHTTVS